MMATLFLIAGILIAVGGLRETSKLRKFLDKTHSKTKFLPQAVTMLIVSAQLSELIRVVGHITIVEVTSASLLLAIVVAAKSGTEGELH
jgi:hypothetical protein